jgi:hypothetical protein
LEETGGEPYLEESAYSYCEVFAIWREGGSSDGVFERDVMEEGSSTAIDDESSAGVVDRE